MKTPSTATKRLPGRMAARAFTLTELLVVLLILSVLLGMLAPSLAKAIGVARRRACATNQSVIVRAAGQYAMTDARKRLPTVFSYNRTTYAGNQGWNNWGSMTKGNPACLWLLVAERQLDRSVFLCPEAETNRRWIAPPLDANCFTYLPVSTKNTVDVSTLSYSFISMTYHAAATGGWRTDPTPPAIAASDQLADQMSMDLVPSTLVVLGDQNPRCTLGAQAIISYSDINTANGGKLTMKARKNSTNHNREGQNITRWDGSANWVLDPNDQSGNDVYSSSHKSPGSETEGRRKEMADPFLIP